MISLLRLAKNSWQETDIQTPAANERFCVIAAVSPQIMQWKLASYYPAGSSVEAATTQSRHHVVGNAGQRSAIGKRKK